MFITINDIEYPTFATVEAADNYFLPKFGSKWAEIKEEDKQKLLITATREINKMDFQGYPLKVGQALAFPRLIGCACNESINPTEELIACACNEPVNPTEELIACCCEVANAIYNLPLTDNLTTPGAENIKSIGIGDTSITYKDGADIEVDVFTATAKPIIKKLLAKYLKGNIQIIL